MMHTQPVQDWIESRVSENESVRLYRHKKEPLSLCCQRAYIRERVYFVCSKCSEIIFSDKLKAAGINPKEIA
jgi:hypothetical protein